MAIFQVLLPFCGISINLKRSISATLTRSLGFFHLVDIILHSIELIIRIYHNPNCFILRREGSFIDKVIKNNVLPIGTTSAIYIIFGMLIFGIIFFHFAAAFLENIDLRGFG